MVTLPSQSNPGDKDSIQVEGDLGADDIGGLNLLQMDRKHTARTRSEYLRSRVQVKALDGKLAKEETTVETILKELADDAGSPELAEEAAILLEEKGIVGQSPDEKDISAEVCPVAGSKEHGFGTGTSVFRDRKQTRSWKLADYWDMPKPSEELCATLGLGKEDGKEWQGLCLSAAAGSLLTEQSDFDPLTLQDDKAAAREVRTDRWQASAEAHCILGNHRHGYQGGRLRPELSSVTPFDRIMTRATEILTMRGHSGFGHTWHRFFKSTAVASYALTT